MRKNKAFKIDVQQLLGFIVFGLFAVPSEGDNALVQKKTRDLHKQELVVFLTKHWAIAVVDADTIQVATDGTIGAGSWGSSWQQTFSLSVSDKFQSRPDKHASFAFELIRINKNGIILKYQATFDHRSFGKNLISIDEGELEIPYSVSYSTKNP
jgi:hypothetical protein